MRTRNECTRHCAQQSARQPVAAAFADDCQTRVAAGFGEDFSRVPLDGLDRCLDACAPRLRGKFFEQFLRRIPDAAVVIVGDRRAVPAWHHRDTVGTDGPDRTVVLLCDSDGSREHLAAVVRSVHSDQNIRRWEGEESSHSLTVCEMPGSGESCLAEAAPRPARHSAQVCPRLGCARTQSPVPPPFANRAKYVSASNESTASGFATRSSACPWISRFTGT